MQIDPYEETIIQASDAAQKGDWPAAIALLEQFIASQPGHARALSALGTCLIQAGQPANAISHFQQVADNNPDSAEAFNNLGVACFHAGQIEAAASAYQQALAVAPDHAQASKNLAVAWLQMGKLADGVALLAQRVQADPQDMEALALLGNCYAEAEDYASARTLYERALTVDPGNESVRSALAALPQAAPARIARPEHAQKLKALKNLSASRPAEPSSAAVKRILFSGVHESLDAARLLTPAKMLSQNGWQVKASRLPPERERDAFDTVVFTRPQQSADCLAFLHECKHAGKRVIVDLDDDFRRMPPEHPGYSQFGAGNPGALAAIDEAVRLADLLTTSSQVLAQRYSHAAKQVAVIPTGWSRGNPLWEKPAPRRNTINIGWVGAAAWRQDIEQFKLGITRTLREFPQALLVIGGDPAALELFGSLAERRRLYLPISPYEDFPYLLSHFDILLAPLEANEYNQAKSDLPLVEAGARGIPWVASALPAYTAWAAGGLLAEDASDWYPALKKLLNDAALRQTLGAAGRAKAEARAAQVSEQWQEAVQTLNA